MTNGRLASAAGGRVVVVVGLVVEVEDVEDVEDVEGVDVVDVGSSTSVAFSRCTGVQEPGAQYTRSTPQAVIVTTPATGCTPYQRRRRCSCAGSYRTVISSLVSAM